MIVGERSDEFVCLKAVWWFAGREVGGGGTPPYELTSHVRLAVMLLTPICHRGYLRYCIVNTSNLLST